MTFEDFYDQHADRVLRILRGRLPACYVEDAAQDVWQRVATHYETSKPTPQWVNKIVTSVVSTMYRYHHRREFTPLSVVGEDAAVDHRDLADILADRERYAIVKAVLTASSPAQRQRVVSYLSNMGEASHSGPERAAMHRFRQKLQEVTA